MKYFLLSLLFTVSLFSFGQTNGSLYIHCGAVNFHDQQLTGFGVNVGLISPLFWKKKGLYFQANFGNALAEGNRNVPSYEELLSWTVTRQEWTHNIRHSWQSSSEYIHLPLRTSRSTLFNFDLSVMRSFAIGNKQSLDVGLGLTYARVSEYYVLETNEMTVLESGVIDNDTQITFIHLFFQKYHLWSPIFSISYKYEINKTLYGLAQVRYLYQNSPFTGFSMAGVGIGFNIK